MIKWNHIIKISFALLFLLSCTEIMSTAKDKNENENTIENQEKESMKTQWIDSVYQSLSLDERIGQLFMIAAYSGGEKYNEELIINLIENHHIGGLIFMQGTAEAQAKLTNKYQSLSKVPLLIGMDAEWGLGMRLSGVQNFPRQMMIGASKDYLLAYELGKHVSLQCNLLGVHINFAPVVDVNNNPNNPVINFRAFGEDKNLVGRLGIGYMKGLQDNNVLACAKHFPGHGDVDVDSHLDLPVITKSKSSLDTLEFVPFQQLFNEGIASVMIAHLSIPELESGKNIPTTLSYNVVTKLLKEEMNYNGLIITDALNMKGVTKYFEAGEVDVKAFLAGNDILLFSQDVPLAKSKIAIEIKANPELEKRLEHSVKKILAAKYDVGLHTKQIIPEENLTIRLNKYVADYRQKVANASLTAVNFDTEIVSRLNKSNSKIAYLPLNGESKEFEELLKTSFSSMEKISSSSRLSNYDIVIVGMHSVALYPGQNRNYGINASTIEQINKLAKSDNIIFVLFGNPYAMKFLCKQKNILVTYEEYTATYHAVIEFLKNNIEAKGSLPVTVCP